VNNQQHNSKAILGILACAVALLMIVWAAAIYLPIIANFLLSRMP